MIYKGVVGSRTYGLNVVTSDTDVAVVSERRNRKSFSLDRRGDLYLWTPTAFSVLRQGARHRWVDYSLLFPYEFCLDNELSRWIVENREDLIRAWLPSVYEAYMVDCAMFARNPMGVNKYIMYAIHFRNMLANYAEGMTFAEALKPQGAARTFLLSVRNGIAPRELVLEENAKARERAKAVAGFYAETKANLAILDEFRHMVYREVELLKA